MDQNTSHERLVLSGIMLSHPNEVVKKNISFILTLSKQSNIPATIYQNISILIGMKEEVVKLGEQNTENPTIWKYLQIIIDSQKTDVQYHDGLVSFL